jgi:predicted kinase
LQQKFKQGEEINADMLAADLLEDAERRFIILMGLPASGKSTLAERLEKVGACRVNRDAIRKRLYGDENIFGDGKQVNIEFYKELREAFSRGKPVISDNVNITIKHRKGAIEAAREAGYNDIVIIFVDVPLEVCLERNKQRTRQSKEDVIRSMHTDMRADGLPRENEGRLLVLHNGKDKEHYRIEMVRDAAPDAPAPAADKTQPAPTEAEVAARRVQLAASLKDQSALFGACIQVGRHEWAAETLATIRQMAEGGAALFGSTAVVAPAVKPTKKKEWVPPTPDEVKETLLKMIGHRPLVTSEGPLVALCFNGHLLNKEKAQLMLSPLLELVKRAHIICFQESNVDALRIIARAARYGLNASHRNVREQACGMLFHPRLQWLGKQPVYHDYLLDVPGHPEYKASLRPGLQQRLKDIPTDFVFDVINLHGKSNLGGPDATRPTRRWAFEALVQELTRQAEKSPYEKREGTNTSALVDYSGWELALGPVLIGGDYNAPIENPATTEIEPLTAAGFRRISTPDNSWSYRYRENGGQFDGFFERGFDGMLTECFIPPFFPKENKRDTVFYRELSDHLPVFATFNVPNRKAPVAVPSETPAA